MATTLRLCRCPKRVYLPLGLLLQPYALLGIRTTVTLQGELAKTDGSDGWMLHVAWMLMVDSRQMRVAVRCRVCSSWLSADQPNLRQVGPRERTLDPYDWLVVLHHRHLLSLLCGFAEARSAQLGTPKEAHHRKILFAHTRNPNYFGH